MVILSAGDYFQLRYFTVICVARLFGLILLFAAAAQAAPYPEPVHGDYVIREGELLYVATSVPHFMQEFYPNPEKFDIDRYEKPRAEHLKPGVYSPYGRGPHTCLGKSLAEVQIALSMARLFYRLDLALEPADYVLKTKTAPTPGPAMNFQVRVKGYRH